MNRECPLVLVIFSLMVLSICGWQSDQNVSDARMGEQKFDASSSNESYTNLCNLGKMLVPYLDNHGDRYPESIDLLDQEYHGFRLDIDWTKKHVKYLGGGKPCKSNPPDMIIAFDETRLAENLDTYVLFNDAHVERVSRDKAIELGLLTQ